MISQETFGDFVISGYLECTNCGNKYTISDGVPCFIPELKFNSDLDYQYLDAHYGTVNYDYWRQMNASEPGRISLDAGCSVGRKTFDNADECGLSVGIDINLSQLKLAAGFQRSGKIRYERKIRALASEEVKSDYKPAMNVLFIQADINNPPFETGAFDFISALNLVDTVKRPLTTLGQMDAMLKPGGMLFLSSPYTWSSDGGEEWLETEEISPHEFMKKVLIGELVPETGFHFKIISALTGIPWMIRRYNAQQFRYVVDAILAEKT